MNGSGKIGWLFGGAVNGAIDPVAKCLDEAFDGLFGDSEADVKEIEGFVHLCIHKEVFGFDVISGYLVENLLRIGDKFIMVEVVLMAADQAKIILVQSLQVVFFLSEIFFEHREEDIEFDLAESLFHRDWYNKRRNCIMKRRN